jgi:hypothetical protein
MSKRTTVTLTDRDEQTVRTFADAGRPEGALLIEAARDLGIQLGPGASEATVIRALIAAGASALREQALERGYEELADIYDELHDADEAAARRRRYAERVDRVMPG